jgi:hypothetical protein
MGTGNRRNFLKGAGVLLGLPMLEAFADPIKAATGSCQAPVRFVNIGTIFGVSKEWLPAETGMDYTFTDQLKPLEKHRKDFTIVGEGRNRNGWRGVHDSCGTLYTCADPRRTPGRAFHNDVSCDQVVGRYLGKHTRYNTIELAHKGENGTGPGHSLAWDATGKPMPGIADPVDLFNHLFGDGKVSPAERTILIKQNRSILDGVRSEAKSIERLVGKEDVDKLDEYFTSIRDIEKRLEKELSWLDVKKPKAPLEIPALKLDGVARVQMMYDLMVAALQTDATRVISYRQPNQIMLKDLEISFDTHQLNHHNNHETFEASKRKDANNAKLLSHFIDKLKQAKELDGKSLFDNTVVNWSSGVAYGHTLGNVPTIVTGGGGGHLKHQGYIKLEDDKNGLSNLWLTTMRAAGISEDKEKQFSDSTGIVEEIWA